MTTKINKRETHIPMTNNKDALRTTIKKGFLELSQTVTL